MTDSYFLWPQSRFLRGGLKGARLVDSTQVEYLLQEMFDQGFPVVVSSGRAGTVLALTAQRLSRSDFVEIFPYAGHCVIESVGRVATPLEFQNLQKCQMRLIYHQWGFVQALHSGTGNLIEDAVDSFCLPGVHLFPNKGIYEIWSLPKLIGSLGGGVVWCRDEQAADDLRILRDARNNNTQLRWTLRAAAQYFPNLAPFWSGAESLGGPCPKWALGDIQNGISHWEEIGQMRCERLSIVKSLQPKWLEQSDSRLPCAVPILASEKQCVELIHLGLSSGYRNFQKICEDGSSELVRVFPVPVHQDVPTALLEEVMRVMHP